MHASCTPCRRRRRAVAAILLAGLLVASTGRAGRLTFPGVEKVRASGLLDALTGSSVTGAERVDVVVLLDGHSELAGRALLDDPAGLQQLRALVAPR